MTSRAEIPRVNKETACQKSKVDNARPLLRL